MRRQTSLGFTPLALAMAIQSMVPAATPHMDLGSGAPDRNLVKVLDVLTKAAQSQLGGTEQAIFFLGDGLQRFAIDELWSLTNPETWTPARLLQISVEAARQFVRTSDLLTSPHTASLAWQELRNKIEIFVLVRNLGAILGLPENGLPSLAEGLEKAYKLPGFFALWAVEGLGNYYAGAYSRHYGTPTGLLSTKNVSVPEKSLLMLHAGMGLYFSDYVLGVGSPTLTAQSSPAAFRTAVERFLAFVDTNARPGYAGPSIESLGLTTRDVYPEMVEKVYGALQQVAPEFSGFFWHGVGRAMYFSRRYFLPVLSTVWTGINTEAHTAPERENAVAGLTWAIVLVNMRQPEVVERSLRTYIEESALQNGFMNGVASSIVMRQATTPDEPFVSSFCRYRHGGAQQQGLWERFIMRPCGAALNEYYPVLRRKNLLGEVFRYQDLPRLIARLGQNTGCAGP